MDLGPCQAARSNQEGGWGPEEKGRGPQEEGQRKGHQSGAKKIDASRLLYLFPIIGDSIDIRRKEKKQIKNVILKIGFYGLFKVYSW